MSNRSCIYTTPDTKLQLAELVRRYHYRSRSEAIRRAVDELHDRERKVKDCDDRPA